MGLSSTRSNRSGATTIKPTRFHQGRLLRLPASVVLLRRFHRLPAIGCLVVASLASLAGCDLLPSPSEHYEYFISRTARDIIYTTFVPGTEEPSFIVRGYGFYGSELNASDVAASLPERLWIPDAELILDDTFSTGETTYRGATTTFGQSGHLVLFALGETYGELYYAVTPLVSVDAGQEISGDIYEIDPGAYYLVHLWRQLPATESAVSLLPD